MRPAEGVTRVSRAHACGLAQVRLEARFHVPRISLNMFGHPLDSTRHYFASVRAQATVINNKLAS